MPHIRKRYIREPFDKLIQHGRIIGILGHRQVGKTTFLEEVAAEYVTLDDEDVLQRALQSPKRFVESLKGMRSAIDECQLVPGLFPALKVKIGTSQIPGRFILSGSVRFTSRKAIRESLTGRIINLELLPFSITEIENEPNSSFFPRLITSNSIENAIHTFLVPTQVHRRNSKSIEKYIQNGGFPGLFHLRDPKVRAAILKDLIGTILDRDLRLVYKTSLPYQEIFEYCSALAESPLQIVRPTRLRSRFRMAESTQKHLLYALESIFLLRRIPVEGDYVGDLFWFEDQIERHHFLGQKAYDEADWITLVYRNLRAQFEYLVGNDASYFSYRTRGGAQIPLCIRSKDGILGVYPIQSKSEINLSLKRSAESFLKIYNHSKVIFVTRDGIDYDAISDRIGVVPAQAALF